MTDRRVVITGLGIITSLGVGKEQYLPALLAGDVGVDRIAAFDPVGFASQIAGEAPHLKMNKIVPKVQRKATKLMSRDIELAVIAADCAVRDSGLRTKASNPEGPIDIDPVRSGVNIGAGSMSCDVTELGMAAQHSVENGQFDIRKWGSEGIESLTPLWLLKYLPNMPSCHLSIIYDLQGPSNSITCAEAGGLLAIGEAYRNIAHGKADVMITGGAESKVHAMGLMRQCMLNRVSINYNDRPKEASRPFDSDADGSVVGDGAGIVVLEELGHAQARGATIYGEIKGIGSSQNFCDDFSLGDNDTDGSVIAMKKALRQAQLKPEQIHLLVPHGLALAKDDRAEAEAIKEVFGEYTPELPITTTKSRIGNCGAGASAIDLVSAVLVMNENIIPANLNCPNIPKEYGLNIKNSNIMNVEIENAMISCYTYGGQTAAMVVSKFTD